MARNATLLEMIRRLVLIALVVIATAAVREILLRRNEHRYGTSQTPYGPDDRSST